MLASLLQKLREPDPSSDQKVVFIHIPKTGGTTFRMVLRKLYPNSFNRCQNPSFNEVLKDLERFQCTEFHVAKAGSKSFYTHKDIIQKPNWRYLEDKHIFVMFRNPVNRVVSSYFEKLRRSDQRHSPELLKKYVSIDGVHNLQTGFLIGMHPSSRKFPERSDLKFAKQLLQSLKINVGIMEHYDESLHLLEFVTGKQISDRNVRVENVTDNTLRAEVDDATRDMIQQKNLLDQELYEYAVDLFEKQLQNSPARKAKRFVYEFPKA